MIEIDKIKLKINGIELELTLDECKKLKQILDRVIPMEVTITSTWPKSDGTITIPPIGIVWTTCEINGNTGTSSSNTYPATHTIN